MKKWFNFKPIETRFDSYKFRSRLEARWACFFKTLDIEYTYEPEGFILEGQRYLPDFWLPEQDCWIEIKGEHPTEEEREKARLLARYTQKTVATFHGNIELPKYTYPRLNSFLDTPPQLWTYREEEKVPRGPSLTRVEAPSYLLAILEQMHPYLELSVHKDFPGSEGTLTVSQQRNSYALDSIDSLISIMQIQQRILKDVEESLLEHEEEITEILTPPPGWEMHFRPQDTGLETEDCYWHECSRCGTLDIGSPYANKHLCKDGTLGDFLPDTPRLKAAYTAAREARFDGRKR